jgi:hypothetical protein
MASQLEAQISEFVGKLGNESESHQKALQRAHVAEKKLEALQSQLSHLEGELLSGDVVRDNLFLEKQKVIMGWRVHGGNVCHMLKLPENVLNIAVLILIMS